MPKERFHLLLADQTLQVLTSLPNSPSLTGEQKFAYCLGAISPDAFFYDLPFFRLSPLGDAFHRIEGASSPAFLGTVIKERNREPTPETAFWLLGVASHMLADGFLHPAIERMTDSDSFFCKKFGLSKRQGHHWLESELEGYWLPGIGPSDGYLPLLKEIARGNKNREDCIRCFRTLLMRMGFREVPDEKRIGRCLFWQALLLRQFSLPARARWRKLFLEFKATRYIGSLIVPLRRGSSPPLICESRWGDSSYGPCDHDLIISAVTFLATHLHPLLQQL